MRTINGIMVETLGEISDEELAIYLEEYQLKRTNKMVRAKVTVKSEDVEIIGYETDFVPFERIRRITGYLVGTLDKWNDAKRKELKDRLMHNSRR
jgi:hypothetical protein